MNVLHTKKINVSIAITFTLFFFIGLCANALAQETVASSSSQIVSTTTVKTVPLSKHPFSIQKQKRITNLSANISNRFDALAIRLQTIATRLESRARKMELQGFDVTSALDSSTKARESLQKVTDDLSTIDTLVEKFVSSEKPQETWIEVKQRYSNIYTHILETKTNLTDAVTALKTSSAIVTSQSATTTVDDATAQ